MDALITAAWRAFWVGLGASAVLIVHGLVGQPPADARSLQTPAPLVEPSMEGQSAESAFARRPAPAYTLSHARVRNAS